MHVSSICNIKTSEGKFTFNKMLFSIFGFILFSPLFWWWGFRGKHSICIKNCHPRVTSIFQGDLELTGGFIRCLCAVRRFKACGFDPKKNFFFSIWFSCTFF